MKTKAARDEETTILNDAIQILMMVKGCSAQVALEELVRAHLSGDIPITAQLIKKPRKDVDDCSD